MQLITGFLSSIAYNLEPHSSAYSSSLIHEQSKANEKKKKQTHYILSPTPHVSKRS